LQQMQATDWVYLTGCQRCYNQLHRIGKSGRVAECTWLEIRRTVRYRGFESHLFLQYQQGFAAMKIVASPFSLVLLVGNL
jgi:hypothetical protein